MSKKRGGGIKVNISLSNRWLYTLILIGILIAVAVGVYAATYTASGAGHPYTEISTCGDGQILKMSGGAWTCATPIQDPPGLWTCTLRTASGSPGGSVVANCVSPEKIINGGCSYDSLGFDGSPTANSGWNCTWAQSWSSLAKVNARVYCCL